jgi:predicted Fe-Mo cluster-binding NifX family protein
MRICIPTEGNGGLDDRVCEHFGRSPTYTIYDTETGEVEILPNTSEHFGGSGLPAELLAQAGVNVVLCAGLGPRAIALLAQYGIEVHTGAFGTVREAIQAWQAGRLSGAEPCERHLFHEH